MEGFVLKHREIQELVKEASHERVLSIPSCQWVCDQSAGLCLLLQTRSWVFSFRFHLVLSSGSITYLTVTRCHQKTGMNELVGTHAYLKIIV